MWIDVRVIKITSVKLSSVCEQTYERTTLRHHFDTKHTSHSNLNQIPGGGCPDVQAGFMYAASRSLGYSCALVKVAQTNSR